MLPACSSPAKRSASDRSRPKAATSPATPTRRQYSLSGTRQPSEHSPLRISRHNSSGRGRASRHRSSVRTEQPIKRASRGNDTQFCNRSTRSRSRRSDTGTSQSPSKPETPWPARKRPSDSVQTRAPGKNPSFTIAGTRSTCTPRTRATSTGPSHVNTGARPRLSAAARRAMEVESSEIIRKVAAPQAFIPPGPPTRSQLSAQWQP